MPQVTDNFIKAVRKIIKTQDYDWLHVIVGNEGVGKTSLGHCLSKKMWPNFNLETDSIFTTDDLISRVKAAKNKPGRAVVVDEGALVFFTRDSMSKANKEAVKLLTGMRQFNMFVVICVPNFWILDRYVREHRVKTVSRVVKRGWFHHYSPKKVKQIRRDKKTLKTIWPDYDFRESFGNSAELWPDEWALYKNKKELLVTESNNKVHKYNASCGKCGYNWLTHSKAVKPACPSCGSRSTTTKS